MKKHKECVECCDDVGFCIQRNCPRKKSVWRRLLDWLASRLRRNNIPSKPKWFRIQWCKFLPGGLHLNEYIEQQLMQKYCTDAQIISDCASRASNHGHADNELLRERIMTSIRAVRCKLRRKG